MINLREQRWAVAVEVCLEGHVRAFCCHDHHDERELEKIMNRVIPPRANKPLVITSPFTVRASCTSLAQHTSRHHPSHEMVAY